ncbi:hypothetical protein ACH518_11885 [Methylomonas sp. HW2-6]|uniref:hypothetical protein n=1 Tax=Methylomonas sp. HW2-6 TaxID=3376687 RepID=UPI004041394D
MLQQRRLPKLTQALLSLSLLLGVASGTPAVAAAAKTGYEVDGRTSASVLAAKRAHTQSAGDETGLAVYSGIFIIGLIMFFAQLLNAKK